MLGPALFWLLSSTVPQSASASLSVTRDVGAESCDDDARIKQRVHGMSHDQVWVDASDATRAIAIRVTFRRASDGAFEAHVGSTGGKVGQRSLRDQSGTCDALSQAVSVAIALLLDSAVGENVDEAAPTTEPAPPVTRIAAEPPADVAARRPSPRRWSARVSVGAGGGYGLGGSPLLGFGNVGLAVGALRLELGALGSLPGSDDYRGGSVRTSLVMGSLRACWLVGSGPTVGPCAELGIGRLRGTGAGFEQSRPSDLLWSAGGLGLGAEAPLGHGLYCRLGATLWVPTRRQTFSVQNAGIAWESEPVAGVLSAALALALF